MLFEYHELLIYKILTPHFSICNICSFCIHKYTSFSNIVFNFFMKNAF